MGALVIPPIVSVDVGANAETTLILETCTLAAMCVEAVGEVAWVSYMVPGSDVDGEVAAHVGSG